MAHFAKVENGIVVTVNVTCDVDETTYAARMAERGEQWVQTSYTNRIRGTYAGIGYSYNEPEDIFITPQPYPSWVRTGSFWNAPVPMPTDGSRYSWDEESGQWNEA